MNVASLDLAVTVAQELRFGQPKGFVKQYRNTVQWCLRLCRLHGPYQTAALLSSEIAKQNERALTPKMLLHNHLLKCVDPSKPSLMAALSEEVDSIRCLEQISCIAGFLRCVDAELERGGQS
jgi:hypothetical protein